MTGKIKKALQEGGIELLIYRAVRWTKLALNSRLRRNDAQSWAAWADSRNLAEVLIINGCYLEAPRRYRVLNVLEQLNFFGVSAKTVFRDELSFEHLKQFNNFIFYRCPSNELILDFIRRAQLENKATFFDIDDLLFDAIYVESIQHLSKLSERELQSYMWHVGAMRETLLACEFGIAPTTEIAECMDGLVKEVFVNRNKLSTELVELSDKALSQKSNQRIENHGESAGLVKIGYLSGSITHNPDLVLIEDALIQVFKDFGNIKLVLVGDVEPSSKLSAWKERIERVQTVNWEDLPRIIANLDINLAPLEDSQFNRAKSEIKWLEASLLGVPTVASDIGSFKEQIEHGVTGMLASTADEWTEAISLLIKDESFYAELSRNCAATVRKNHSVKHSGYGLREFIKKSSRSFVVFVIPTIEMSGGLRVILHHARILKEADANVVLWVDDQVDQDHLEFQGTRFRVYAVNAQQFHVEIDLMVATLWTTVRIVQQQPRVHKKVYLVQNYEVDFNSTKNLERQMEASSTYCQSPEFEYLTISRWCQEWLTQNYAIRSDYVPNGIDWKCFSAKARDISSWERRSIHVLVEGNADDQYKNISESLEIIERLKERYNIVCHHLAYRARSDHPAIDTVHFQIPFDEVVNIYASCDLLIKSSVLESFSYPPIEMMATGGMVIVARNGGNSEYVRDGINCLTYDAGKIEDAIAQFDKIYSDDSLRAALATAGKKTAESRDWESVKQTIIESWNKYLDGQLV